MEHLCRGLLTCRFVGPVCWKPVCAPPCWVVGAETRSPRAAQAERRPPAARAEAPGTGGCRRAGPERRHRRVRGLGRLGRLGRLGGTGPMGGGPAGGNGPDGGPAPDAPVLTDGPSPSCGGAGKACCPGCDCSAGGCCVAKCVASGSACGYVPGTCATARAAAAATGAELLRRVRAAPPPAPRATGGCAPDAAPRPASPVATTPSGGKAGLRRPDVQCNGGICGNAGSRLALLAARPARAAAAATTTTASPRARLRCR